MTVETTRSAIVRAEAFRIEAYLPSNYEVIRYVEGEGMLIAGYDNAGWTLDGYVLPRLASGLMFGTEVTGRECIVDGSVDRFTYDDCACRTCRRMQREANEITS